MRLSKAMKQDIINYLGIKPDRRTIDFKYLINNYGGYELVIEVLIEQVKKIKAENLSKITEDYQTKLETKLEAKLEAKDPVNYIYPQDLINCHYSHYPSHLKYSLDKFINNYVKDDYHSLNKKSRKYCVGVYNNIIECFHNMKKNEFFLKHLSEYKKTKNELDKNKFIDRLLLKHFAYGYTEDLIQFMIINNFKINIETLELSKYKN